MEYIKTNLSDARVTKVQVLFRMLVFVFNFDLFEFSAAILEKGLLEQMTAYCPGGYHLQINEITIYLAHEEEHFWSLIQVRTSQMSQSALFTNKAEKS